MSPELNQIQQKFPTLWKPIFPRRIVKLEITYIVETRHHKDSLINMLNNIFMKI